MRSVREAALSPFGSLAHRHGAASSVSPATSSLGHSGIDIREPRTSRGLSVHGPTGARAAGHVLELGRPAAADRCVGCDETV